MPAHNTCMTAQIQVVHSTTKLQWEMNSDVYNVNADGINEKSDLFFFYIQSIKKNKH